MSDTIDFGVYKTLEWEKLSTEYLHGLCDMGNEQASIELEKIYNSPIETQKVGFGKYAGTYWVALEIDYLYWILQNVDSTNIKHKLASKALEYIENHSEKDEFGDVIYVD